MTLEEMISNVETSIQQLKDFLVQENLLVEDPNSENGKLIENQDPDAVAAYNARKFLDIRF